MTPDSFLAVTVMPSSEMGDLDGARVEKERMSSVPGTSHATCLSCL